MENEIKNCRVCMSKELVPVLNLGKQAMSGIFPKNMFEKVETGTLELVKCMGECGLLQSRYSFDRYLMYGENYGYESAINETMRSHLKNKVNRIKDIVELNDGDLVVDIGSNDGTLLKFYPSNLNRIGIDPSAKRFSQEYKDKEIDLIIDYFDNRIIRHTSKKAKVITSIAMFYDLEQPLHFMMNVKNLLHKEGIWVIEQSYMPFMLKNNSYDTICHEHIEYYSLSQIKWMADHVGLKIIDINFNDINGGSFEVFLSHDSMYGQNVNKIQKTLLFEDQFVDIEPFEKFRLNVNSNRDFLVSNLKMLYNKNMKIFGYGASTKGNVILQYCGLTNLDIECIADRNPHKVGRFTPNTDIPIVSEEEARSKRPDFFLVLCWHFKNEIIQRENKFLLDGGKLLFPLPNLRVERIN